MLVSSLAFLVCYKPQLIFCQRTKCIMQNTFASVDMCYMVVSYQQCQSIASLTEWWTDMHRARTTEREREWQTNNNQRSNIKGETISSFHV